MIYLRKILKSQILCNENAIYKFVYCKFDQYAICISIKLTVGLLAHAHM